MHTSKKIILGGLPTLNKSLALLWSIMAVIILIAVGISLSYQNLWLAAALIALYIVQVGVGFILKARLARKNQNPPQ